MEREEEQARGGPPVSFPTGPRIPNSITAARSSDASRSLENHPIPFHPDFTSPYSHPYSYFLYAPSPLPPPPPHPNPRVPNIKTATPRTPSLSNPSSPPPPFPDPDADPATASPGCGLDLEEIGVTTECGPGCEYAGEFLTTDEARRRQRTYDELASSGRLSPALLVVREHLPSGKACLRVNIDATKAGNVARFINHSCDGGNLLSVLVRISGSLLPRLCFFAAKDVSEGKELAFSYGEARLRQKGLPCFCGSDVCCDLLPSEASGLH